MASAAQGRISAGVGFNLIGQHTAERNQEATVYAGNLDPQVAEELLWELFIQAGPVVNMYVPKDRVTSQHQGYGFVEFRSEEDADYAIRVLNMIKLYGKPIRVNKATQDKTTLDVGANLFVGNLDADVDEKLLYDTFSAFGVIVSTPKLMREELTGNSRGFGFISYDSFEASDAAIDAMNGQHLCNRPITVTYAYKKDTKGERHGDPAERHMAAQAKAVKDERNRPHTLFATGPRPEPQAPPPPPGAPGQYQPPPPPMAPSGQGNMMQPPPPPLQGMMPPPAQPPPPLHGMPPPSMPPHPPPPSSMPPPPFQAPPPMQGPPSGPPPTGMPPPMGMMPPPSNMPPPPLSSGPPPPMGMPPPPFQGGGPPGMPPPPMQGQGGPNMAPPPHGMPPGMPPPPGSIPPWQRQQQNPQQPPPPFYNNAPPPPQ